MRYSVNAWQAYLRPHKNILVVMMIVCEAHTRVNEIVTHRDTPSGWTGDGRLEALGLRGNRAPGGNVLPWKALNARTSA